MVSLRYMKRLISILSCSSEEHNRQWCLSHYNSRNYAINTLQCISWNSTIKSKEFGDENSLYYLQVKLATSFLLSFSLLKLPKCFPISIFHPSKVLLFKTHIETQIPFFFLFFFSDTIFFKQSLKTSMILMGLPEWSTRKSGVCSHREWLQMRHSSLKIFFRIAH